MKDIITRAQRAIIREEAAYGRCRAESAQMAEEAASESVMWVGRRTSSVTARFQLKDERTFLVGTSLSLPAAAATTIFHADCA